MCSAAGRQAAAGDPPCVPTGMNMGVSHTKCGSVILDALALPHCANTSNCRAGDELLGSGDAPAGAVAMMAAPALSDVSGMRCHVVKTLRRQIACVLEWQASALQPMDRACSVC